MAPSHEDVAPAPQEMPMFAEAPAPLKRRPRSKRCEPYLKQPAAFERSRAPVEAVSETATFETPAFEEPAPVEAFSEAATFETPAFEEPAPVEAFSEAATFETPAFEEPAPVEAVSETAAFESPAFFETVSEPSDAIRDCCGIRGRASG